MYENQRRKLTPLPRLPPGAQHPAIPSPTLPSAFSSYSLQVTPPALNNHARLDNPWDNLPTPSLPPPRNPPSGRQRVFSMQEQSSPWPLASEAPQFPFPEPQIQVHRAASHQAQSARPQQKVMHHYSRSDLGGSNAGLNNLRTNPSVLSLASSYNANADYYSNEGYDDEGSSELAKGLSAMLLQSEEGLERFQKGELPDADQEWYRLVPEEAREALGKQEVQRQSVLFEVIKSEREYVADLEAVEDVYVERLRKAQPPIIEEPALSGFLQEVFGNLREILAHHQRILAALFARQRDQHPLMQSVADIVLDTTLKSDFRTAYETYIKHYPLAESHHRNQRKRNRAYEVFVQSVSEDPRIRKRDLITFLSRPVTRLPRLNLLLEQLLKLTDPEHPDCETLPIILGILRDCIKSTQPGIEAAEGKVKFWALCESLVFQKGEIIDMDLYDESRSLVYMGPVFRRSKSDTGFTEKWTDLVAALLDNYFVLAREQQQPNGTVKRLLMSRPLPLSFLRLGAFDGPPESKKGKSEEGGLLDSFRSQTVPIYPFTIYHAANRSSRRYTLYVTSEAARKKWHISFVNANAIHKVRQESNMWFSPQVVTDGFFRLPKFPNPPAAVSKVTGKIQCAVPFVTGSKRYIAVGCGPGIYVAPAGSEKYTWVLNHRNPTSLAAFTTLGSKTFNRFIVHVDSKLVSYSLEILARVGQGQAQRQTLEASIEKIVDDNVSFCKHIHVGPRALLVYASKRRIMSSMHLNVLEAVDISEQSIAPKRTIVSKARGFRPYGEPGYVPKDAYEVISLARTIGICTSSGIVMADPSSLANSPVALVPDFQDASNNLPMAALKAQVEGLKPLGVARVDPNELLVIYDEIGCYINKHGVPTRRCGYIKWETKAQAYAIRNGHILLHSFAFVEIRNVTTGRIVQVIEGEDIRLLYCLPYHNKADPVLLVMKGSKNDEEGQSEKIVELVETEEISVLSPTLATPSLWDEWDM